MKKLKRYNNYIQESLKDKMTPISDEQIQKLIDELDFDLIGDDLEEKGNFGQTLTDVYATKEDGIYFKLGQIRLLGNISIFYPDFRRIESYIVSIYTTVDNPRELTNEEKSTVIIQLGKDKKFGSLMDDPKTYLDIIKKFISRK